MKNEDFSYFCFYRFKKVEVKIVFVTNAKTRVLIVYRKQTFSNINYINTMIFSIKTEEILRDLEELEGSQSKV